jgi:hypothetical protein
MRWTERRIAILVTVVFLAVCWRLGILGAGGG